MKVLIKTTVEKQVETEIPVPFFARKKDERKYIAVLDENTFVAIFSCQGLTTVTNSSLDNHEKRQVLEAWQDEEWTHCTETEFLEKYDSVIESISLHPKLAV